MNNVDDVDSIIAALNVVVQRQPASAQQGWWFGRNRYFCNKGVQSCHLFHTYFLLNRLLLPNLNK
jgi:hypothetical protein